MKYSNSPAGYDSCRSKEEDPWWQHPAFPLLPQFEYRRGDEWNANNWTFSWLWLRLWTLEHFAFEISAEVDSTGLNVKSIIGWLRVVIRIIPMPYAWLDWARRNPATPSNDKDKGREP